MSKSNFLEITGLYIYPIKSCGAIELKTLSVTERGPALDREWMLVDAGGKFLSQRTHPKLCLIQPQIIQGSTTQEVLVLQDHKKNTIEFSLDQTEAEKTVEVWGDQCLAREVSKKVSRWFSNFLNEECFLVKMREDFNRFSSKKYPQAQLHFADGFPFLLTSESSLNEVNQLLGTKLPMNQFRPNIVIGGGEAFVEDKIKRASLGNILFDFVKPCARCVIIGTNQSTAEVNKNSLVDLSKIRKQEKGVMFGQNLVHQGVGVLKVGDPLQIVH